MPPRGAVATVRKILYKLFPKDANKVITHSFSTQSRYKNAVVTIYLIISLAPRNVC
jgi:hypothetical protein